MRRTFTSYLVTVLCLALFGGIAWLTRHPDAEILHQAQDWPWIGQLASHFREAYRKRPDRPDDINTSTEEVRISEPDASGAGESQPAQAFRQQVFRQQVWALDGMELKANPSADAATLHTFEKLARISKIERQGDWYHVDHLGRVGWVLLEGYDEDAEIPYGEVPDPPKPLPSRAPDEESLAAARKYLLGQERVVDLGPYVLYTDCQNDDLISYLATVAGGLEAVYAERYGRRPVGDAAEAIVLFQSEIAYRLVQQRTASLAGLKSAGHNSEGIAMLYSGGRSRSDAARTVIHELTHFLNRRAIGPQLPPWLDEGIADDLGLAHIDTVGGIHPAELAGDRQPRGDTWRIEGGFAALLKLRNAILEGKMPAVLALMQADWEGFVRTPQVELHYAAAAFWIRYLVEGENGRYAADFHAFLDAVATGEPPTTDTLQAKLGEPWSALDAGFRAWIKQLATSAQLD